MDLPLYCPTTCLFDKMQTIIAIRRTRTCCDWKCITYMSYKLFCEVHIHPELCETGQLLHRVSVLHRWMHEKMHRGFTRALKCNAVIRITARGMLHFPIFPTVLPTFENFPKSHINVNIFSQIWEALVQRRTLAPHGRKVLCRRRLNGWIVTYAGWLTGRWGAPLDQQFETFFKAGF